MSQLSDRIAYLKGLREGMQLDMEKNTHKLLSEIVELLDLVGGTIEQLQEDQESINEYVETIDDDLSELESTLFGEEEDESDELFQDGDEPNETISYHCPHCDYELTLALTDIDFTEDIPCPKCGKPVFPEFDEEEDEPSEDE